MSYEIDNGAISQEDEFIGHGDYACMMHMAALKSELEALRATEDCTAQEIEIKALRELKRFIMKQVSQSIDGIIGEHQALMTIVYRINDNSNHIPDTEKPANKGRL